MRRRGRTAGWLLTIWRWGRQNSYLLFDGKPLGSYEVWAQWCRDPLVNLGARDPVDRIATTKAVDPGRNNILVVYEAWWAAHGNKEVPAKNLDSSVVDAIAETAAGRDGGIRYSRQYIAKWLVKHTNTRVGGYVLISILIESPKTPRPVYHYALKLTKNE